MTIIAEYIWLDSKNNLRSKTKIFNTIVTPNNLSTTLKTFPAWNYDGSSTGQATGEYSELILKPCAFYRNPLKSTTPHNSKLYFLVLCETYDSKGNPMPSNNRARAAKIFMTEQAQEHKPWFGIEQEYFLIGGKFPLQRNIRKGEAPIEQGQYYCSVGTKNAFYREIAEEHMEACLDAGLNISGINAEVAPCQWEYQIGPCKGIDSGDQLWISRWLMERISEKHNVVVNWHPKPFQHINGSGCHTNYSTEIMRQKTSENKGLVAIFEAIKKLEETHAEHMEIYGKDNDKRMSGQYETSCYDKFIFDVSCPVNRGASIRVSYDTINNGCGYFEDRRPASNRDPYLVTSKLFESTVLNND